MEVEELHKCQPTVYKEGKESPWNLCAPAGETLQDAKKRVVGAIKKLSKKWGDNFCAAIVASEPSAGLIRFVLKNGDCSNPDLWNLTQSQGTFELIEISKEDLSKL
jgi:broad specificity phosphatase PhoE